MVSPRRIIWRGTWWMGSKNSGMVGEWMGEWLNDSCIGDGDLGWMRLKQGRRGGDKQTAMTFDDRKNNGAYWNEEHWLKRERVEWQEDEWKWNEMNLEKHVGDVFVDVDEVDGWRKMKGWEKKERRKDEKMEDGDGEKEKKRKKKLLFGNKKKKKKDGK